MRLKVLTALAVAVIATAYAVAAAGPARAGVTNDFRRSAMTSLTAGASCHDPCDDPFWLKAWVRHPSGAGVAKPAA